MYFSLKATAATLIASSVVNAAPTAIEKPFQLAVISSNATLNGQILSPCHWHVLVQALCPQPAIKTTTVRDSFNSTKKPSGGFNLNWDLNQGQSNTQMVLNFTIGTSMYSNVADAMLVNAGYPTDVFFDEKDKMYLQGRADDRRVPIEEYAVENYYRWYVCNTVYNSYRYQTLAWSQGEPAPQNPTCQKIDVKRVYF
jgi:hypothetical protein